MIKVLHKSFRLIELIAHTPETPHSVSELAKRSGLNLPTTTRILQDLVSLGYVEQISRSEGYILGPMSYLLPGRGEYMRELQEIARPLIKNCAETIRQSVLLCVTKAGKRYILYHENFNPGLKFTITQFHYDDFYHTATGRVLLAYMPDVEQEAIIQQRGLPVDAWDWEWIKTERDLRKALSDIKIQASYKGTNTPCSMEVMGVPVFKNSVFVAVVGATMPAFSDKTEQNIAFKKVKETAKLISLGLSQAATYA